MVLIDLDFGVEFVGDGGVGGDETVFIVFEHEVFLFDLEFRLDGIFLLFLSFDFFLLGVVGRGNLED